MTFTTIVPTIAVMKIRVSWLVMLLGPFFFGLFLGLEKNCRSTAAATARQRATRWEAGCTKLGRGVPFELALDGMPPQIGYGSRTQSVYSRLPFRSVARRYAGTRAAMPRVREGRCDEIV